MKGSTSVQAGFSPASERQPMLGKLLLSFGESGKEFVLPWQPVVRLVRAEWCGGRCLRAFKTECLQLPVGQKALLQSSARTHIPPITFEVTQNPCSWKYQMSSIHFISLFSFGCCTERQRKQDFFAFLVLERKNWPL